MYLRLKNGNKALIISELPEDLVPFSNSEYPKGKYEGFSLYIDLSSGKMYAKKV